MEEPPQMAGFSKDVSIRVCSTQPAPNNQPVPMLAAYEQVTQTVNVKEVPASEKVGRYVADYIDEYNVQYDFG